MTQSSPEIVEDKLQSLRWHVINNTVNKGILVGLIEDAIRLSRPAQAPSVPDVGDLYAAASGHPQHRDQPQTPLGPCTQAELEAFEGLDDKSKRLFSMWVERALKAEAAQASPERTAELQYEAGMYKSLYEAAIARSSESTRDAAIEECAKHLEHEADVATNSLHCGDNSQTIAATHRVSRAYYEAAKSIRALAVTRPDRAPYPPQTMEEAAANNFGLTIDDLGEDDE